jgi:hypothetical protein
MLIPFALSLSKGKWNVFQQPAREKNLYWVLIIECAEGENVHDAFTPWIQVILCVLCG